MKKPRHHQNGEEIKAICIDKLKWWPDHVAEVGVFTPEHCEVLPFINDPSCRVDLIEPQPQCAEALRQVFGDRPNVTVHEVAIVQKEGDAILMVQQKGKPFGAASMKGIAGPQAYLCSVPVVVKGAPFNTLDDGSFDILSLDMEGAEWDVLDTMTSRPKVIVIEMVVFDGRYTNPNTGSIMMWMSDHGYRKEFALGVGGGDWGYVRS